MGKHVDSGKAYHVKKKQRLKNKRKKILRKQIREGRRKGLDTTALRILLSLES